MNAQDFTRDEKVRRLVSSGMEQDQADAVIETCGNIDMSQFATKTDLREATSELRGEIAGLRTELKTEMADLRTEMKTEMADFRTEIASQFGSFKVSLYGFITLGMLSMTGAIIAVVVATS